MFRSISDQLYATVERHAEVRQQIVNYMEQHHDHFSLFIEDDELFEDYVVRMRTSGEWGGHQELYAASCCFHANIIVYQLQAPRWILPCPEHECACAPPSSPSVFLSYHGEHHYNSLHPDGKLHSTPGESFTHTSCADSGGKDSKEDRETVEREREREREETREQLLQTLPWLSALHAVRALEVCGGALPPAVEYAIEHFFGEEEEEEGEEGAVVVAGALQQLEEGSVMLPPSPPPPLSPPSPSSSATAAGSTAIPDSNSASSSSSFSSAASGAARSSRGSKAKKLKIPAGLSKKVRQHLHHQ
jgi:hypothetical protein